MYLPLMRRKELNRHERRVLIIQGRYLPWTLDNELDNPAFSLSCCNTDEHSQTHQHQQDDSEGFTHTIRSFRGSKFRKVPLVSWQDPSIHMPGFLSPSVKIGGAGSGDLARLLVVSLSDCVRPFAGSIHETWFLQLQRHVHGSNAVSQGEPKRSTILPSGPVSDVDFRPWISRADNLPPGVAAGTGWAADAGAMTDRIRRR